MVLLAHSRRLKQIAVVIIHPQLNPIFTGTFQKGILGGFSGKVRTVIGGNWKGIDYMCSKGSNGNKNPTQPLLWQQLKFSLCIRFLQTMSGQYRKCIVENFKKAALIMAAFFVGL